jgi:hypothetical protein
MDYLKTLFKVGAIGVGLVLASVAAEAKRYIKGAIVGALGGHYVGRGLSSLEVGAVAHDAARIGGHWPEPRGTIYIGAQTRARNRAPRATFTFALGTDAGYALAAGPGLRLGTSFAFALDRSGLAKRPLGSGLRVAKG